jgi:hypothetical protein
MPFAEPVCRALVTMHPYNFRLDSSLYHDSPKANPTLKM